MSRWDGWGNRTGNTNKESGVKDRYGKQEHGIVEVKTGLVSSAF